MDYVTVKEIAQRWGLAERTVRNYCAKGQIKGAIRKGKTWQIPANTQKPERKIATKPKNLLEILRYEKEHNLSGGIYHKIQIELTYNSNHIEGSRLTHEQTRYIYETHTIHTENEAISIDDIVETANHFRCIDRIIEQATKPLSETFIKELHFILKNGTKDSRKSWFAVGQYKKMPNEVGGKQTVAPENVSKAMKALLKNYNAIKTKTLEDIIAFHYDFEKIHPFQDGNGRIGRLILFKECLHYGIVPFIIDENLKWFYYRGLQAWQNERGFLLDTCLMAQDQFKLYLDYFRIAYY